VAKNEKRRRNICALHFSAGMTPPKHHHVLKLARKNTPIWRSDYGCMTQSCMCFENVPFVQKKRNHSEHVQLLHGELNLPRMRHTDKLSTEYHSRSFVPGFWHRQTGLISTVITTKQRTATGKLLYHYHYQVNISILSSRVDRKRLEIS
jgi:hypothetical protein